MKKRLKMSHTFPQRVEISYQPPFPPSLLLSVVLFSPFFSFLSALKSLFPLFYSFLPPFFFISISLFSVLWLSISVILSSPHSHLNPFPLSLSILLFSSLCFSPLFHLSFFFSLSRRRIKHIVSFSSLFHTSPRDMSLSLFL